MGEKALASDVASHYFGFVDGKDESVAWVYETAIRLFPRKKLPDLEAEDIREAASQTVEKLFMHFCDAGRPPIEDPRKFRAYIAVTVRNTATSILRSRTREILTETDDLDRYPTAAQADAETVVDDKRRRETLRDLVNALPQGEREALELHLYDDLGDQEIGKRLGITANAAKQRWKRGKKKVIDKLRGSEINDD